MNEFLKYTSFGLTKNEKYIHIWVFLFFGNTFDLGKYAVPIPGVVEKINQLQDLIAYVLTREVL